MTIDQDVSPAPLYKPSFEQIEAAATALLTDAVEGVRYKPEIFLFPVSPHATFPPVLEPAMFADAMPGAIRSLMNRLEGDPALVRNLAARKPEDISLAVLAEHEIVLDARESDYDPWPSMSRVRLEDSRCPEVKKGIFSLTKTDWDVLFQWGILHKKSLAQVIAFMAIYKESDGLKSIRAETRALARSLRSSLTGLDGDVLARQIQRTIGTHTL